LERRLLNNILRCQLLILRFLCWLALLLSARARIVTRRHQIILVLAVIVFNFVLVALVVVVIIIIIGVVAAFSFAIVIVEYLELLCLLLPVRILRLPATILLQLLGVETVLVGVGVGGFLASFGVAGEEVVQSLLVLSAVIRDVGDLMLSDDLLLVLRHPLQQVLVQV
jgi:hypothetical protein